MTKPMCNCGADFETTIDYFLCWRIYLVRQLELLDGEDKLDSTHQNSSENLFDQQICSSFCMLLCRIDCK